MILIDTSIWVDHFRRHHASLIELLETGQVCVHPYVIGELACGNLKPRRNILDELRLMPTLQTASDDELLFFIERHCLMGRGIGYIDIHLLAATAMHGSTRFWTRDKKLAAISSELQLAYLKGKH